MIHDAKERSYNSSMNRPLNTRNIRKALAIGSFTHNRAQMARIFSDERVNGRRFKIALDSTQEQRDNLQQILSDWYPDYQVKVTYHRNGDKAGERWQRFMSRYPTICCYFKHR